MTYLQKPSVSFHFQGIRDNAETFQSSDFSKHGSLDQARQPHLVRNAVLMPHPRCRKPGILGVGVGPPGLTSLPGDSDAAKLVREPLP